LHDTDSPVVLKEGQCIRRHFEIDEINRFPFGCRTERGKGGCESRAFPLLWNPEGEKTEGNGDSQPLNDAFNKGSALILFPDQDYHRTLLL
jgi:hypothetical protein